MEELNLILKEIIAASYDNELKKTQILQYHENDIASVLEYLTKEERLALYNILGDEIVSVIFSYLDNVEEYIEEISNKKAADLIELMDADDAIDVLEELDEEDRDKIISLMEPEVITDIELINQYEDNELGSKMTNNFIIISKDNTIRSAMKSVIKQAADNDNVSIIYVEDDSKKYYGTIDLRDLIIARDGESLEKIIKQNHPTFYATEDISDIITKLADYGLESYPVLNDKDEIIGAFTSEDVIEELSEEMKDDYAKFAGLTEEEDLSESVFQSVKKRIPWLSILLILSLLVSLLISNFEGVVSAIPIIVFFQSLILGMAGNTGTQSLAVTIRLLTDEEINKKNVFKTIFKEIRVGFLNGLLLGILSFIFVFIYLLISKQPITEATFSYIDALEVSGIVSISLLLAMTLSCAIGSIIPIIFKKINIDPAVASGPFITTLNDVIAVVIYYGLATILFIGI